MTSEEFPAPQCPEALYNRDTGDLLRCVQQGRHDWHRTPGGTEWRVPVDVDQETECPF
ncbi:hypothetical protein GLX30_30210 [Streptomyces sp. Tu 2975]|uniref:hypothetical protein n=1 Tax=Streptomyces sp. Tu 2975 TaxID=2676871 RepID=UPI001356EA4C|nr:hypothetical protein [Streptomyces sp. Tu 2975]QIP87591.1 hypothetical protein GLX30_30210 [Streptomyces sp. Tu 2975]